IHQAGPVTLNIYDIQGRFVRRLVHGYHTPGAYSAHFSAGNLASGTYICRLTGNQVSRSAKMILLK
ncbi:MAG: T9SS type A sorting domain-containing protein, partial [Fidelibacterota bacterium]